jgi:hypothetical protein
MGGFSQQEPPSVTHSAKTLAITASTVIAFVASLILFDAAPLLAALIALLVGGCILLATLE